MKEFIVTSLNGTSIWINGNNISHAFLRKEVKGDRHTSPTPEATVILMNNGIGIKAIPSDIKQFMIGVK